MSRPRLFWLPAFVCAVFLTPAIAGVVLYLLAEHREPALVAGAFAAASITWLVARWTLATSAEATTMGVLAAAVAVCVQLAVWSGVS